MLRIRKQTVKRDVVGFRLPMLIHEQFTLDLTDIVVIDPDNTYYMRMGSNAMAGYHILAGHILVIDRSLEPVQGSIVVFFHEGEYYTREYHPISSTELLLKADTDKDNIKVTTGDHTQCWGVVIVTLNPVIHKNHKVGKYANVCAC